MAEQATERTTIAAPPDVVYATALDIEHYPEWAHDIKEATIVDRDDEGRPLRVRFRAAAMGHSARYVLRYDHGEAPRRLSWILEQGDIVRRLDGEYVFDPAAPRSPTASKPSSRCHCPGSSSAGPRARS